MGDRANAVIVEDGGLAVYYDGGAAVEMTWDLLGDGERGTLDRIRAMQRVGLVRGEAWLDADSADGALVLDPRRRQLLMFESAGWGTVPRLSAHLIESTWPGWTVTWASEGQHGVLAALGQAPEPHDAVAPGRGDPQVLSDPHGAIRAVLSVRLRDGIVRTMAAACSLDTLSTLWWEDVVAVVGWSSPPASWATASGGTLDWPDQGFFVDVAARELRWWSTAPEHEHLAVIHHCWPGFEVVPLGDHWEWHERAADLHGIQPPQRTLVERARQHFLRRASERTVRPSDRSIVEHLRREGSSTPSGRTLAALDDLLGPDAPSLPPVRFVDASGRVVDHR